MGRVTPDPPAATEIVRRPDPGLARGAVEGPPWLFYAVVLVAVVVSGLALLHRLGRLPRLPFRAPPRSSIPPSRRSSIPPPRSTRTR